MLADLLNPFEKVGASLTDECVAKLSTESTDIVTERGIEFGGSVRHVGTVAGTARARPGLVRPLTVQPISFGNAGQCGLDPVDAGPFGESLQHDFFDL